MFSSIYFYVVIYLKGNGRQTELVLSVRTPILPPRNVKLQKTDSSYILIWKKPSSVS